MKGIGLYLIVSRDGYKDLQSPQLRTLNFEKENQNDSTFSFQRQKQEKISCSFRNNLLDFDLGNRDVDIEKLQNLRTLRNFLDPPLIMILKFLFHSVVVWPLGADTRIRKVRSYEPSILRKKIKMIQCIYFHDKIHWRILNYLTWTKFRVDKISQFSRFLLLFNNRPLFHNNR